MEDEKRNLIKLIRVNVDAHEGFKTAAENTNDILLNTFFKKCSSDRKTYAENLAKEIGSEVMDHISTDLKADLHRVWMNLKTAGQKFDSEDVLEECARGEKYALEQYSKVLKTGEYSSAVQSMIEFQKNDISSKYEQIQKLLKQYKDDDNLLNRQTPVP